MSRLLTSNGNLSLPCLLHEEISLVFQARFRRFSGFFWILQEFLKILQDF